MNSPVSLFDVAVAAGVSISTASRVICGKATGNRISQATQNRVSTKARELGYQPNLIARDIVLGKPFRGAKPQSGSADNKSQMTEGPLKWRQIGIILTPTTSADTLNLIPGLIPVLAAAGYGLAIHTVPADPVGVTGQLPRMIGDGVAGILCCPSVYSVVSTQVAGTCPVIVLWPGAGKAMLKSVSPPQADAPVAHSGQGAECSGQLPVGSGQGTVGSENAVTTSPTPRQPASPPVSNVVLAVPIAATPPMPAPVIPATPAPAVTLEPPPVSPTPEEPASPPLAPPSVSMEEPAAPEVVTSEMPVPAFTPDATPTPALESEPVIPATPAPAVTLEPPPVSPTPEEPASPPLAPPSVSMEEPAAPEVVTSEMSVPVFTPDATSTPVLETEPAIPATPTPAITLEQPPVSPTPEEAASPPLAPPPVSMEEPAAPEIAPAETPAPALESEPVSTPVSPGS